MNDMLSEKDLVNIAIQEGCLLEDYKKANNYVGIKIQQAKIDLLDSIILSKDKPNEYVDIEDQKDNPLDQEMIELINALNKYNIKTKQCCSGHSQEQAQISIDLSRSNILFGVQQNRLVINWDINPELLRAKKIKNCKCSGRIMD